MTKLEIEPMVAQLRAAGEAADPAEALAALRAAQALLTEALENLAVAEEMADATGAEGGDDAARFRGPGLGIDPQAEDRLLIERILAMPGISDDLRDELGVMRGELENGPLSSADRRYLIALRQRLARVSPRPA